MSVEHDYQEFAATFCDKCSQATIDEVLELYADDVVTEVAVRAELFPVSLPSNKAELGDFLRAGRSKGTVVLTCENYLVNGNRISIEAVGRLPAGPNGEEYRNRYAFFLTMRDGKIAHMREYMDTLYAKEAFLKMMAQ